MTDIIPVTRLAMTVKHAAEDLYETNGLAETIAVLGVATEA